MAEDSMELYGGKSKREIKEMWKKIFLPLQVIKCLSCGDKITGS